ncbi:hypothetical protein EMPS_06614 [Entomortierella parvispora]|uniref:3CxxC-type domain-containing protein n=1 Tax=Entomortierella parvispora TaxID=205924 RepID=A0A9P3HCK1_9FUNG|nr:hypothetical protein EMPS_06614 [Entomortierella parvispora]
MAKNKNGKVPATTAAASAASSVPTLSILLTPGASPALLAAEVTKVDRQELNRLDMSSTPVWARHIIHQERCRRKIQDQRLGKPNTSSTAAASPTITTAATTSTTTTSAQPKIPPTTTAASMAATAAKSTYKLKLPAKATAKALEDLRDKLPKLDRTDLNMISMQTTPSWARSLINNERCRRKKVDTPVESVLKSLEVAMETSSAEASATPAEVAARASAFADTAEPSSDNSGYVLSSDDDFEPISPSTSSSALPTHRAIVAKAEKPRKKQKNPGKAGNYGRPVASQKTKDGSYLHDELVEAAANKTTSSLWDCTLIYDSTLKQSESMHSDIEQRGRDMFGRFHCTSCRMRGKPRTWHSAEVFTQFWCKYTPASGFRGSKDTLKYQSLIYFQKCRGCEQYMEAELDRDSYVRSTIKAFELWTGRRERQYRNDGSDSEETTKPHDKARCHGCIMGLHHGGNRTDYPHRWGY